jgi:hypothetical protein
MRNSVIHIAHPVLLRYLKGYNNYWTDTLNRGNVTLALNFDKEASRNEA